MGSPCELYVNLNTIYEGNPFVNFKFHFYGKSHITLMLNFNRKSSYEFIWVIFRTKLKHKFVGFHINDVSNLHCTTLIIAIY